MNNFISVTSKPRIQNISSIADMLISSGHQGRHGHEFLGMDFPSSVLQALEALSNDAM
jgi:hypothetical protein